MNQYRTTLELGQLQDLRACGVCSELTLLCDPRINEVYVSKTMVVAQALFMHHTMKTLG